MKTPNKRLSIAAGTVLGLALAIGAGMMVIHHLDLIKKIGTVIAYGIGMCCFLVIFNPLEYLPFGGTSGSSSDNNGQTVSRRFRKPLGMIPNPYDPSHGFTDIYGNQYYKVCGTWYDDDDNPLPDYLKDAYGITAYENDHE